MKMAWGEESINSEMRIGVPGMNIRSHQAGEILISLKRRAGRYTATNCVIFR